MEKMSNKILTVNQQPVMLIPLRVQTPYLHFVSDWMREGDVQSLYPLSDYLPCWPLRAKQNQF